MIILPLSMKLSHNFTTLHLASSLLMYISLWRKSTKDSWEVNERTVIITDYLKAIIERKKIFYFHYNCVLCKQNFNRQINVDEKKLDTEGYQWGG